MGRVRGSVNETSDLLACQYRRSTEVVPQRQYSKYFASVRQSPYYCDQTRLSLKGARPAPAEVHWIAGKVLTIFPM